MDPIRALNNIASLGIGKWEEDDAWTDAENVKRKALESEITLTDEQVKKREQQVEKDKAIKEEVSQITKVFFCELCNKQYKMIREYEAHLSSYDHNHKKVCQAIICNE